MARTMLVHAFHWFCVDYKRPSSTPLLTRVPHGTTTGARMTTEPTIALTCGKAPIAAGVAAWVFDRGRLVPIAVTITPLCAKPRGLQDGATGRKGCLA
jgi:hypothetical protein